MQTRKEQKFSGKPWISESILNSINNKNNLYKYLQTHDNHELKKKYNKMKKILKKTIFAVEQNFYERLFDKYQNDSKKIWSLINEITCCEKRNKTTIKSLKKLMGAQQLIPKQLLIH